jgi:outer membrane protein with beta-barrel domain
MKSRIALFIAALAIVAAPSYAQENGAGPGTVEVTVIPGGGMFFVNGNSESHFRNYDVGGTVGVNFNRYVGVEGVVNAALGLNHQNLLLSGVSMTEAPPNVIDYSGNLNISAPVVHGTVPYASAGLGSLVLLQHTDLGIGSSKAFLTGNVGGGLKWYANRNWGLRADYRFVMVRSSDLAPAFFGQEGRFGHRIYGGVILNVVK